MTPKVKLGLMAGGFVALAVAAVAGWVRKPEPAAAAAGYAGNPEPVAAPAAAGSSDTAGTASRSTVYDQYGQPRYAQQNAQPLYDNSSYSAPPYNSYSAPAADACQNPPALPAYASPRYVRTVRGLAYAGSAGGFWQASAAGAE